MTMDAKQIAQRILDVPFQWSNISYWLDLSRVRCQDQWIADLQIASDEEWKRWVDALLDILSELHEDNKSPREIPFILSLFDLENSWTYMDQDDSTLCGLDCSALRAALTRSYSGTQTDCIRSRSIAKQMYNRINNGKSSSNVIPVLSYFNWDRVHSSHSGKLKPLLIYKKNPAVHASFDMEKMILESSDCREFEGYADLIKHDIVSVYSKESLVRRLKFIRHAIIHQVIGNIFKRVQPQNDALSDKQTSHNTIGEATRAYWTDYYTIKVSPPLSIDHLAKYIRVIFMARSFIPENVSIRKYFQTFDLKHENDDSDFIHFHDTNPFLKVKFVEYVESLALEIPPSDIASRAKAVSGLFNQIIEVFNFLSKLPYQCVAFNLAALFFSPASDCIVVMADDWQIKSVDEDVTKKRATTCLEFVLKTLFSNFDQSTEKVSNFYKELKAFQKQPSTQDSIVFEGVASDRSKTEIIDSTFSRGFKTYDADALKQVFMGL